jgi:hypothetical protein
MDFVKLLMELIYGCETWSVTLWVEHRLRVFENRVLKRIFSLGVGEGVKWQESGEN